MPYAMFHAQIYFLTCSYVQIYMLRVFMPCFSMFYASFSSKLMLGLHVHMFVWCYWLCFARIYVFIRFLPCFMFRSTSVYAYMLGFMFFHVYVLSFYMSTCMCLCLYVYVYVFTCHCAWIYVLYMLYAIFHVLVRSMPCLCAQIQAIFAMSCAIVALLSLYLSFLCFGLLVRTRSRPYGLYHRPYTLAHIKWFGSSLFCMSMLACFYALCLCQPLQFQAFHA